ncbi:hypothetical protein [Nonomuraea sp. NPDC005650]
MLNELPGYLDLVADLPRTGSNKIQTRRLRSRTDMTLPGWR